MDASSSPAVPAGAASAPALPAVKKARLPAWLRGPLGLLKNKLFLVTVLLPTLAAGVYFGAVASDVYISESRFVVRSAQRQQQGSLVGALLQGTGFQRAQDDTFSVHDYMQSRDALAYLDRKLQLARKFRQDTIDFFSRFPGLLFDGSFESLYQYYQRRVQVDYDSATGITTLRVNAFGAADARAINEALLAQAETLINDVNVRGREDAIRFARDEVAEAEAKAREAALALANFRTDRAVFDPERQSALQLQQVGKLQDELIAAKTQLALLKSLAPENPQIPSIEDRVSLLQREINQQMAGVAGAGPNSLTDKASQYERLALDRAFADRQLASALSSLETARNDARRKQLYLERIVQPNLPDFPLEPRRLRAVAATLLLGLVAWGVLSMLLAGVREHRD